MLCGFSIEDDLTLQKFMKFVWSCHSKFLKTVLTAQTLPKNSTADFLSKYSPWNNSHQVNISHIQTNACGKGIGLLIFFLWEPFGDLHEIAFSPCLTAFSGTRSVWYFQLWTRLSLFSEYYYLEFYTRYSIFWSAV